MTKIYNRLFEKNVLAFLLIFCVYINSVSAQTGEWVELINGKDFTGWKASENANTWTVIDGMFQCDGKRSHLWYEGEHLKDGFKNFELEVQVKTFKLANSGIYFHTEYQETYWPNKGFEIQVNNTHIGEDEYIEYKRMGSLYGIRNLYKSLFKDNQWITIKVRVELNRVQIWCDGIKTVDYLQPDSTGRGVKRLGTGTFCLQGHDVLSKAQYRSFKVRTLPDDSKSSLIANVSSTWDDSMRAFQKENMAFIDLNPKPVWSASKLISYFNISGINVSLVKTLSSQTELISSMKQPLFLGLKINSKEIGKQIASGVDYVIGESVDLTSARLLLASGKVDIWSDKGNTLNLQNADELLALANQYSVAIEIDNQKRTPSVEVIKKAKAHGLKFSFSGLIVEPGVKPSNYVFEVIKAAKINYKELFIPKW